MTTYNNPSPDRALGLKGAVLMIAAGGMIALAAYVGITEDICREISAGKVSLADQQSMHLSPEKCQLNWWEKL